MTTLTRGQTDRLEALLGCPLDRDPTPALIDVGARWIVAQTSDAGSVLETIPDYEGLRKHDKELGTTGVCIFGEYGDDDYAHIEVRSFAPACGVDEDPVCGSGNGSVAAFLNHYGRGFISNQTILSTQGKMRGRHGEIELSQVGGKIYVGGNAITCISGFISA
ncbi:MAG: PhzF family phenazine biosynthesis protein [Desulfofustis sp.]